MPEAEAKFESEAAPTAELPAILPPEPSRRDDVEFKQEKLAQLLADTNCEGLLLLEPANFRWLTSGAEVRGLYHAGECPALFVNSNQRWLLCNSIDTQRFFDEEIDGLGFQVKEWPWHASRETFIADLVFSRKIACDQAYKDCKHVGSFLEQERRRLGVFEQDDCQKLSGLAVHAVEATCRNIEQGDTEEEVAGQLAHRLLKHGVQPVALQVSADGRSRSYRRPGCSAQSIRRNCTIEATAGKFGLFVTLSRTVWLEPPDDPSKLEYEIACRIMAYWNATVKTEEHMPHVYGIAANVMRNTPYEHEWRLNPPGWWTGRSPSELLFTLGTEVRFEERQLAVWQARVGGAVICDTYIFQENLWNSMTGVEEWPVRRYVIQGTHIELPDLLFRNPAYSSNGQE